MKDRSYIKSEQDKWGSLVKKLGLRGRNSRRQQESWSGVCRPSPEGCAAGERPASTSIAVPVM